jgi:hypothetical protein
MSNVTCSVSPVVSHDTSSLDAQNASIAQPSAATPDLGLLDTVAKFAAPANELVQLETDCKNWEATELAAAHARLYQLLTRAYSYYLVMKTDADKKKRDDYKKALSTFIELRNYKFLSTSDDMHRVVKAVFGSDRRRVSAYSIALKTAMASGVPAANLASWFTAQGGVEEVRSAKSSTNTDQAPDHEKAATSLADQVLMRIKPDAVTMPMGVEDNDKPIVLLAVYRPTGDLELKAIVSDAAVVKAAFASYYKTNKEKINAAQAANQPKADSIGDQMAKHAA